MILAADLDRTLIFSRHCLEGRAAVVAVEYRQGEPFGFMTPGALQALRALKSPLFINTLRGYEQAQRVGFIAENHCRYLALQNGLYLYHNGQEDKDWSEHVRKTVDSLGISLSDGTQKVLFELSGIQCLSKQYQYLAVFFVEESQFDDSACIQLAQALALQGWELYRQRKKLYLSPLPIHKGTVLNRVRAWEGREDATGFGDSWFDIPMLRTCNTAWSLQGCELEAMKLDFPIHFSKAPAQAGTEETLNAILKMQNFVGEQ